MTIIGLTGGIASGKSTVANMLVKHGAHLVDADIMARRAVAPGSPALDQIKETFGEKVIAADGALDRAELRKVAFNDEEARAKLNEIVHPEVAKLIGEELVRIERDHPDAVAVVDVPLLFESGWQKLFAATVVVSVDEKTQIQRLMARDNASLVEARHALATQMPLAQKRAMANFFIDNSGSVEETREKVAKLWEGIKALVVA